MGVNSYRHDTEQQGRNGKLCNTKSGHHMHVGGMLCARRCLARGVWGHAPPRKF